MNKLFLLLCLVFFLNASASATNYREDSFQYFGTKTTAMFGIFPLLNLKVKEKKRLVLINGEVITPVEYSDGSSFSYDTSASENVTSWDGDALHTYAYDSTNAVIVNIADFNGDGHADQLLTQTMAAFPIALIIYGSANDMPLKIEEIQDGTGSGVNTAVYDFEIKDVDGDGKSDILFTARFGNGYTHAVAYGASSGLTAITWQHPGSPAYSVAESSAKKPSNGQVAPGGTSGSFRVNESGAATFSMPIFSPKGPAGMQFGLGLSYSSQGGNGPLGKGWSMSAGSTIARCPTTAFQNTDTTKKQFCLNGGRLVELSDGSGTQRTFATEISDISKITANYASSGDDVPLSFEILRKDGTYHQFIKIGDTTWITDKIHNPLRSAYLQYEYLDIGLAPYTKTPSALSQVTLKTSAGDVVAKTVYEYEDRLDSINVFMDGGNKILNKRLAKINVESSNEIIRSYHMSYGRSALTGVSTLAYIQECGLNGICYEPITFEWSKRSISETLIQYKDIDKSAIDQVLTGNFNQDNFSDIAVIVGNKIYTYLGDEEGNLNLPFKYGMPEYSELTNFSGGANSARKIISMDYNRDGVTDIVTLDYLYKGEKETDEFCTNYYVTVCPNVHELEFNVTPYITSSSVYINPNAPNFNLHSFVKIDTLTSVYKAPYFKPNTADTSFVLNLQDINGDAITDIVFSVHTTKPTAGYPIRPVGVYGILGEGSAAGLTYPSELKPSNDGVVNILGGLSNTELCAAGENPFFYTGGFDNSTNALLNTHYYLADVDNDGYTDIVTNGEMSCSPYTLPPYSKSNDVKNAKLTENWFVLYSPLGSNSRSGVKLDIPGQSKILLSDFNGDGFTDVHSDTALYLNKGNAEFVRRSKLLEIGSPTNILLNSDSVSNYLPLEINADGITDFAIFEDNKTLRFGYHEEGKMRYYDMPAEPDLEGSSDWLHSPLNIDVNGDSILDVVTVSNKGRITTYLMGTTEDSQPDDAPDVIKTITSSNGLKTKIEYGVANLDSSLYQKDADAQQPNNVWALDAPVFDVTGAVHLVKRVTDDAPSTANANDTVSKRYSYVGGKLQAGGRGFLGFRKLIEIDETFNVKTVTEYAQQFPYTGMPLYTYKVKSGVAFDDTGITGFVSEDIYQAVDEASIVTGFQPLSNLDEHGQSTVNGIYKNTCRDSIYTNIDKAEGMAWLSCSRNILNVKEFATASGQHKYNPVFPYIETSVEEVFHTRTEFNGAATFQNRGGLLKTIITNTEYAGTIDNFYGEMTGQTVTTSAVSGDTMISHITTSSFQYDENDVSKWWLGRLTNQQVNTRYTQGNYTAARVYTPGTSTGIQPRSSTGGSTGTATTYEPGTSFSSLQDYDLSYFTSYLDGDTNGVTRQTRFSYNQNGQLQSSTVEPDQPDLALITEYTYDTWGNKTQVIKKSHASAASDLQFWRKAETVYDTYGIYPTHVYEYPNGQGSQRLVSEVTSRNALGLVESVSGQNGVTSYKTYDGFGRALTASSSAGSAAYTDYSYCATDIHAPAGCYMVQTTTANNAPSQKIFTDKLGQTLRSSKVGFAGSWLHVDAKYDKIGRAIESSNPHTGSADLWSTTDYDIFGRPVRVVYPNGATVAKQYDGFYTTTTDENGYNKSSLVNVVGKPVYVKEFSTAGEVETIHKHMHFKYDTQGNQTQIIGDGSLVTTQYNLIGQAISTTDPAKGTWHYRKNASGELISQLNAKGDYTRNTYDDAGRLTNRTISLLTSGTIQAPVLAATLETATWVYDTAANGIGKIHNVTGSSNYMGIGTSYAESYDYNGFAQLKGKTTTIDGISYKDSWTYDAVGRMDVHYDASNGLSSAPSKGTKTHYDTNHYVSGLSNAPGDHFYFTPLDSDNWGNITEFKYGNGVITKATYDEYQGRLIQLSAGKNGNNDEIMDASYHFDAAGNLDYKTDAQLGYKEDITYDDTYRIKNVSAQGIFAGQETSVDAYNLSLTYYANSSNIKTKSNYENGAQYTYADATSCNGNQCGPNVLTSIANLTFEYDANGNRIKEKRLALVERESAFTAYDKPWSITKGNNSAKFAYGAASQRIKQISVTDGVSKTLHYLGNVEMQQKDGAWYYKRRIAGYAIEEQVKNTDTGLIDLSLNYLHKDYQGSVIAITNSSGAIQQRLSYDVYGARRNVLYNHSTGFITPTSSLYDHIGVATYRVDVSNVTELIRETALDSRGYTGHEHLDGVELIHMNGRVFDPVSALFISADPNIPDASNQYYMNRYSYGFNNPVTYTDPSGYFSVSSFFRAVGVMGINALIPGAVDEHERFRKSEHGQLAYSIAITVISGGAGVGWAMAGGFASGYMATGTMEGAALGALFAGASFGVGEIAGQIGNAYAAAATRAVMHGALGGIRARMNGGSFSSGFKSAGIVSIVGDIGGYASSGIEAPAAKIAAAAVLGGTISEMSGGKFANGAISAAFVQAYNHGNHTEEQQGGAESLHAMLDENGLAYDTVIWDQSTGQYQIITSDGSVIPGKGYSGALGATNNPNLEGVKNYGPIPKGVYAGIRQDNGTIKLIPYKSIDMNGRNKFSIHGDYRPESPKYVLYGASKGCPIINLGNRNRISNFSKLIVTGSNEWNTSI